MPQINQCPKNTHLTFQLMFHSESSTHHSMCGLQVP